MLAVVLNRPKLKGYAEHLRRIYARAESCARQLTAWERSIEQLPFKGRRHMPHSQRSSAEASRKAHEYRIKFLLSIKPEHPLYNSPEARAARGEPEGTGA
jgi:hypothetical protein